MSITKEQVLAMDYAAIVAAVKSQDRAVATKMQELLRDRQVVAYVSQKSMEHNAALEAREAELGEKAKTVPPTTDELAAEAAAVASTPDPSVPAPASAEVVATPAAPVTPAAPDHSQEDLEWLAEGVTVSRDGSGKIVQMVQEYQVKDGDGHAIGRPTRLVARGPQDLNRLQREAHSEATRAFSRLKKQKMSFKEQEKQRPLTVEEIKAAAKKALESKDENEALNVVKGVLETTLSQREQEVQRKRAEQEGFATTNIFLRNHLHDYLPNEANNKLLLDYILQNQLEWTLDNLEAAFEILMSEDKLVKVPVKSLPQTTATVKTITPPPEAPQPAQPAAVLPPAPAVAAVDAVSAQPAAVSTPVVEATVTTPAAPQSTAPAARRPGVNGGIPPGQFSANRPELKDPAQARKDFMKSVRDMDPKILAGKVNPNSPKYDAEFAKTLTSYGVKIR